MTHQFPAPVWVEGELSNCSYPSSGHIYFCLVDPAATDRTGQRLILPCAFFKGVNQHLTFKLADGMKVLCLGEVTTYDGRGQYQLRVLRVEVQGIGALQVRFDQLKKALQAEGLFDPARRRPIPRWPTRIGVITSLTGSAIHDMVSKLRGWFRVVIVPTRVQGEGAAADIAQAIDLANRLAVAEVLIVGRGGGSVEDLWAFNEEPVARAIARSRIPVISAVGHDDDWTIADYVADLRASTPTDAAKGLAREREVIAEQARASAERLVEGMRGWLEEHGARVESLCGRMQLLHPLHQIERSRARAEALQQRLVQRTQHALDAQERSLQGLAGRLQALSPLAVLARGYSITFTLPDGHVASDATMLRQGDELETRLAKGRVKSTVTAVLPTQAETHGAA